MGQCNREMTGVLTERNTALSEPKIQSENSKILSDAVANLPRFRNTQKRLRKALIFAERKRSTGWTSLRIETDMETKSLANKKLNSYALKTTELSRWIKSYEEQNILLLNWHAKRLECKVSKLFHNSSVSGKSNDVSSFESLVGVFSLR